MPEPISSDGLPAGALEGKRIVLGVCGGIAAYKSVELLRTLTKSGANVSVVMTANAARFVGAATFDALVESRAVVGDLWHHEDPSPHTTLGRSADLVLVAPATARLIADYAIGRSGDALSATLLATTAPVVLCPAMHTEMWQNPAVRSNIELLRKRGVEVVDPETGALAGGDFGEGRLAALEPIRSAVLSVLQQRPTGALAGKRIVVTAGGTREPIDAVRFVGNRSSGRQGHAVATSAAARGASVTLITTTPFEPLPGVEVIRVETAQQMLDAVRTRYDQSDVLVMAAAVADFRPASPAPEKIKKSGGAPTIELEATVDILADLARLPRSGRIVVGFAAETSDLVPNAEQKLRAKALDVIVANDVSRPGSGFDHVTNDVTIIDRDGHQYTTGLVDKRTVAAHLLDAVERVMRAGRTVEQ